MPCFSPKKAWRHGNVFKGFGPLFFDEPAPGEEVATLLLPCRKCIGCRTSHQQDWATRLLHEGKQHSEKMFLTLTYDDDHLSDDEDLHYEDVQKFLKKLRFAYKDKKIRFFCTGEYGEQTGRPHWHLLLYGVWFEDTKRVNQESKNFDSRIARKLWPQGNITIQEVNAQTTRYVAKYVVKKITGELAQRHYQHITRHGELVTRKPEFARMSLKPGIGDGWFRRYYRDWFPRDHCIVEGKKVPVPAFYLRKLKKLDPTRETEVRIGREIKNDDPKTQKERTPERLAVREKVAKGFLKLRPKGKI